MLEPDSADVVDVDLRMRAHARANPHARALSDGHRSLSWDQLDRRLNRIANALIAVGLRAEDTIALLGRNSLDYAEIMLGALRAGCCVAPLSTLSTHAVSATMVADSGARILFAAPDDLAAVSALASAMPDLLPDGLKLIGGDPADDRSLSAFIREASEALPDVRPSPQWGFNLIYSSGTTGTPKGILQSRAYRALESQRVIETTDLSTDSCTIVSTPLYSNTTLFVLFAMLAAGGSAAIVDRFDPEAYLALCEQTRPTHIILVPVQFDRIMAYPDFANFDLSSLRTKFSTSAPLHAALKRDILARWPAGGLVEIYGMTEGGVSCILVAQDHPDKLDTVGRPTPGCDLKILDDDGTELPPGRAGEIVGRSETMMSGYYGRDEATREASWFDAQGRRYQRSGDIGYLDTEGFLHLLDRKKDVIISGGFNLYATDLEAVLLQHPDVMDAAVVGMPSQAWGETPAAFLVLRPAGASTEAVRSWANARLGKAQRISAAEAIDELPRSPIGKVLKRELRDRLFSADALQAGEL
jgi:long-chain acyl-CoA synthetase